MKVRLSKLDAARRQLHVAIRMYFNHGDIVAMHTLAAAAFSVVKNMLDANNSNDSPTQWVNEIISPENRKLFWSKLNATANFLKHANQDPDTFHEFSPIETENLLFMAAYHYRRLTEDDTPETRFMVNWYFMQHPNFVSSSQSKMLEGKELFGNDRASYWKEAMALIQSQPF